MKRITILPYGPCWPGAPLVLLATALVLVACGRTTLGTGSDETTGGAAGDFGGVGGNAGFKGGNSGGFANTGGAHMAGAGGSTKGGSGGGSGGSAGSAGGTGGMAVGGIGGGPVSALLIDPGFVSITAGQSVQLRATVQQAGITLDVTNQAMWSVAITDIATMTATRPGRVTGVAVGQTQVKVSLMGLTAVSDVKVVGDTLVSLSLRPSETSVNEGGVVQVSAIGSFSSGQQRDLTADVEWMSAATDVAVTNHLGVPGLVLAVAPGITTIGAMLNGNHATLTLTVLGDARLNVLLEPTDAVRRPGETFLFHATGVFADGTQRNLTNNAVWISSNPLVATVDRGLARCLGTGDVVIVASFDGFSAQGTLSCREVTILLLRLTPAQTEVPEGTRLQYTATAFFSDGTSRIVTDLTRFSTLNMQVADVTTRGQVTAIAAGMTTIAGLFEGVTGQATLTVQ